MKPTQYLPGFPPTYTIEQDSSSFPSKLKEISQSPATLYVTSTSDPKTLLNERPAVAIVGTRDPSPYGKSIVYRLVEQLSTMNEKPVIISGLALGIDYEAHRAAIGYGLPTIAVMPTGPDAIYPQRHLELARQISATPGSALITDFQPGTTPMAINMLRRNRIIAGLCNTMVLIESKEKGGGIIAARLAFDLGKKVYAVPGRIDDIRSAGCNILIQEGVAEILHDIQKISIE